MLATFNLDHVENRVLISDRPNCVGGQRSAPIVDDRQSAARKSDADGPGLATKIGVLQGRHARRGLGLPVHHEKTAAPLRRPVVNLCLNARVERSARLSEHLDRIRDDANAVLFRQPPLIVAVLCGVASYSMMNLIMTSAPIAMIDCNHSITDATLGLQWHVMAMYAPSFFTGALMTRFGIDRVVWSGLAIMAVAMVVAITGITVWHFWVALALLGIGWNFAFIGASTMVMQCHRPNERNKVQAFNDFLIFGSMAIGSFSSGALLVNFGWTTVHEVIFPVVFVAAALLAWSVLRGRARLA